MISPTAILYLLLALSLFLVVLVTARPSLTTTRGGKILAFLSFFIFPLLSASLGVSEHLERSKTTQFCLSCHVMQDYGKSLYLDDRSHVPAVHFQNQMVPRDRACYTCHTDYTMYGDLSAKLRGLRHVYVQYLGTTPQTVKLYQSYNNRECLHCHAGARSFEEGATHTADPETFAQIKSNQLSCTSSGCHEQVHNVAGLKDAKFWKGTP